MADLNYSPGLEPYVSVSPFKAWCQRVIPAVYDGSISVYEMLCKLTAYINQIIDNMDGQQTDITNLLNAYKQLQEYVNTYFDDLDVQDEINNKLDTMASSGELTALITPWFQTSYNDLSARVATLEATVASLETGTVPGDDEVVNARIGRNGYNYPSLRSAIIYQSQTNYTGLELADMMPLQYNTNGLWQNMGIDPSSGEAIASQGYNLTGFIALETTRTCITNYTSGNININMAYYNAAQELVGNRIDFTIGSGQTTYRDTPDDAVYLRISANGELSVYRGPHRLTALQNGFWLNRKVDAYVWQDNTAFIGTAEGSYLDEPSDQTNNAYSTSQYIGVRGNMTYMIGPVISQGCYVAWLDGDFNWIRTDVLQNRYTMVKSPANAWLAILTIGTIYGNFKMVPAHEFNWYDVGVVFYGDSIFAQGNTQNFSTIQGQLNAYYNAQGPVYSVGIGSTGYCWVTGEPGYDFSGYEGGNLPENAMMSGGTNAALCSFARIQTLIGKNNPNLIFIIGGTNDINYTLGDCTFDSSNTTDDAWHNFSPIGDYDVTTIMGGVCSMIMKIRAIAPDAQIVVCTPPSGRGYSGQNAPMNLVVGDGGLTTFDIAEGIKKACAYMSTPCIDVYGTDGIQQFNRTNYIQDSVHPNAYGRRAIASAISNGFNNFKWLY